MGNEAHVFYSDVLSGESCNGEGKQDWAGEKVSKDVVLPRV